MTDDPEKVAEASKVILPGVGAFEDAMKALRERGLVEPIVDSINSGRPFLGICLGLQLLFERSYEDGEHEGLGVLPGEVRRFEVPPEYKVPHMGWNRLRLVRPAPVLEGADGAHFYFVHSYYAVPANEENVAAVADYPEPFCAAVWRDNLVATQFHPEKSQTDGLRILKNFAELGG